MRRVGSSGFFAGTLLLVTMGCTQESARSTTAPVPPPPASAAAEDRYPAVPASSPQPWTRFVLERAMGATCSTRAQRNSSGRSVLLPADECLGPAPRPLAKVVLSLAPTDLAESEEERLKALDDAAYVASPGLGKRPDFMLATETFWVRSFEAPDPRDTVYLVQGVACTAHALECQGGTGVRAFRFAANGKLADVSDQVLPAAPTLSEAEIRRYDPYAEPIPLLDTSRLWTVPVLRWVIELDPDAPLADDPRYYNDWAYVHFGFLVWKGRRFALTDKVDRLHWPCRPVPEGEPECSGSLDKMGDRFVTP
ncbi:hypothetical protein [Xanthomonas tesorieronis]|uniref:hypothetical protein n=1 Tax=Xanthomonas tesorieronis TaxID=3160839 RepID=UPI003515FD68